jgi:ribosomal-protein-alanine N-acetyltransferase
MVTVRALEPGHLPLLFEIAKKVLSPLWREAEYEYFVKRRDAYNLGLFDGDELLSFVLSLRSGNELDIVAVATAPVVQKKGYAAHLMNWLATDSTVRRIQLEVDCTNEAAVKLYLKSGFQVVGLRKKYYEGKKDAWLMVFKKD